MARTILAVPSIHIKRPCVPNAPLTALAMSGISCAASGCREVNHTPGTASHTNRSRRSDRSRSEPDETDDKTRGHRKWIRLPSKYSKLDSYYDSTEIAGAESTERLACNVRQRLESGE